MYIPTAITFERSNRRYGYTKFVLCFYCLPEGDLILLAIVGIKVLMTFLTLLINIRFLGSSIKIGNIMWKFSLINEKRWTSIPTQCKNGLDINFVWCSLNTCLRLGCHFARYLCTFVSQLRGLNHSLSAPPTPTWLIQTNNYSSLASNSLIQKLLFVSHTIKPSSLCEGMCVPHNVSLAKSFPSCLWFLGLRACPTFTLYLCWKMHFWVLNLLAQT